MRQWGRPYLKMMSPTDQAARTKVRRLLLDVTIPTVFIGKQGHTTLKRCPNRRSIYQNRDRAVQTTVCRLLLDGCIGARFITPGIPISSPNPYGIYKGTT